MWKTESKVEEGGDGGKLSKAEGGLCLLIFASFVLISMYKVKVVSTGLDLYFDEYDDFANGWSFIGKKRDAADYEWEMAKLLLTSLFPWILGQMFVTELFRRRELHRLLPLVQIVFTVLYVFFHFSIYSVFLLIYQPLVFRIFGKTSRKAVVWCCALLNLVLLEAFKSCEKYGCLSAFEMTELEHSIMVLAVYWINLRCICFYINLAEGSDKISLANALSYCLYLPTLFFGPIINYDEFVKSRSDQNCSFLIRLRTFTAKVVRFMFWWVFTDFWLHYIYVNVISLHPQMVYRFNSLTLYGFGYCMGQFFHLKYVVMYGLSTTVAEFDNIPIPNVPKCIGRIHLYSDMWKYFDNGLYKFLLRYIYLPIKEYMSSKYFASFVCFSFIYVWHGFMRIDILIWTCLNYFAVSVEYLCNHLYRQHLRKHVILYFDARWEKRFICALNAPLLMLSALSNFYFFGGVDIGNIFMIRAVTDELQSTMLLLFSLYCCGQLSIMVKRWEKDASPLKVCTAHIK